MSARGDVHDSGDSGAGAPSVNQRCPSAGDMAAGSPKEAFITGMSSSAEEDEAIKLFGADKSAVIDLQVTLTEGDNGDSEHRALLWEAEERAAQQEMARRTMLTLADVLEELTKEKRQLVKQLEEERKSSTTLKAGWGKMATELARVTELHERQMAKELLATGMESGNRFMWPMMLERSRLGISSRLFGPDNTEVGPRGYSWQELYEGDRVTILWVLRCWQREAKIQKKSKVAEQAKKERQKMEDDLKAQVQGEVQDTIAQWKERCAELERRLSEANRKQREFESQCGQEQQEVQRTRATHEREKKLMVQAQEELSNELQSVRTLVINRDMQMQTMKREAEMERAANKVKEKEYEVEIAALKEKIRKITGELEQAVILARHMRETALKVKRDAAKSVSPEKFSQLVVQLEELRDKLDVTSKDNEHLRQDRGWLQDKLDRNQRRLELERQFLPLVHAARGPLGGVKDFGTKPQKEAIDEKAVPAGSRFSAAEKTALPVSRSLPALPGTGPRGGMALGGQLGSPLGSPLGASH